MGLEHIAGVAVGFELDCAAFLGLCSSAAWVMIPTTPSPWVRVQMCHMVLARFPGPQSPPHSGRRTHGKAIGKYSKKKKNTGVDYIGIGLAFNLRIASSFLILQDSRVPRTTLFWIWGTSRLSVMYHNQYTLRILADQDEEASSYISSVYCFHRLGIKSAFDSKPVVPPVYSYR